MTRVKAVVVAMFDVILVKAVVVAMFDVILVKAVVVAMFDSDSCEGGCCSDV